MVRQHLPIRTVFRNQQQLKIDYHDHHDNDQQQQPEKEDQIRQDRAGYPEEEKGPGPFPIYGTDSGMESERLHEDYSDSKIK